MRERKRKRWAVIRALRNPSKEPWSQDARGSSTFAFIQSKVPSYFIGEESEVQRGDSYPKVLSMSVADQRIQTCLGVLESPGFDSH